MNWRWMGLLILVVACRSPELVSGYFTANSAYTAENRKYFDDNYTLFISDSVVWIRNKENIHTYPITKIKGEYDLFSPPLYKLYYNQRKKYIQIKHRVKSRNYDYSLPNEAYSVLYWLDGLRQIEQPNDPKRAD